jgi:hypothetical protein
MKTLLLALLLYVPLLATAQAETAVRGFNPRFSASSDFPDEPNLRSDRRQPRFDVAVDIDAERRWRRERREQCRDSRRCRRH